MNLDSLAYPKFAKILIKIKLLKKLMKKLRLKAVNCFLPLIRLN